MSCNHCGQQTPRSRLCKQCAILDRDYADTTMPTDAPACAQCDGDAEDGDYNPRTPGVWLCRDCLEEQAVACDGGQR